VMSHKHLSHIRVHFLGTRRVTQIRLSEVTASLRRSVGKPSRDACTSSRSALAVLVATPSAHADMVVAWADAFEHLG
jgi:hypothetical protein